MSEAAAPSTPAPSAAPAEAAKPAEAAAPVVEAKADTSPKRKVKVDGKELEITDDELVKGYQLEASARKRAQEAAEEKKAATAEREKFGKIGAALKAGDYNALRDAGLSDQEIEQLSIRVLSAKHQAILEEERRKALDPQQREIEDKLQERDRLLDEKKKAEDTVRAGKVSQAKQALSKAVIDTMQEFPESVRKNESLAQNVFEAWAYCVTHPEEAKELGIDPTPKGIAKAIRKRQLEIAAAMVASADDEELPNVVSESIAAKILAKRKAAAEAAAHPSLTSQPQVRGEAAKPVNGARKRGNIVRSLTLGSLGLKE